MAVPHHLLHQKLRDLLFQTAAHVIQGSLSGLFSRHGCKFLVERIRVTEQHFRILHFDHIAEDSACAFHALEHAASHNRECIVVLKTLRLLYRKTRKRIVVHRQCLAERNVIVRIFHGVAVRHDYGSAVFHKRFHLFFHLRLRNDHLRQDHNFIRRKFSVLRNHVHADILIIECFIKLLHLRRRVEQNALALDAERCQGIVIVHDRRLVLHRGFHRFSVFYNIMEEALYFIEFSAFHIIRINDTIAELLRTFCRPAVTEIHQGIGAVCHTLIRPHLRLVRTRQKARHIVALRSHDRLGNPEILTF